MPIAYDGPHQVRWDATSWQGFTRLSTSNEINNSNDTDAEWEFLTWEYDESDIDDDVVDEQYLYWLVADDDAWAAPWDIYDTMDVAYGGLDLTSEGYARWWAGQGA